MAGKIGWKWSSHIWLLGARNGTTAFANWCYLPKLNTVYKPSEPAFLLPGIHLTATWTSVHRRERPGPPPHGTIHNSPTWEGTRMSVNVRTAAVEHWTARISKHFCKGLDSNLFHFYRLRAINLCPVFCVYFLCNPLKTLRPIPGSWACS